MIAEEFGVDKAADVMDSVEVEPLFDELFVQGLQDPSSIDQECEEVIDHVREKVNAYRSDNDLLTEVHTLEADDARKWRDHPAQFWLERAITTGLTGRGGNAVKNDDSWQVTWMDGSKSPRVCFDARTAEQNPELEWVTLEDPRARAVISDLPRFVAGQPVPLVTVSGLPATVQGVWSLWEISLSAGSSSSQFNRKRFLPVFVMDNGRSFVPTAKRIWDLLLTEHVQIQQTSELQYAVTWFDASFKAAQTQGEQLFNELLEEHRSWLSEERNRATYSFESRQQAIGRIGLPAVREHRRKRLQAEHETRIADLRDAEACMPDMNAVLVLRIAQSGSTA